ncbi:diguanylate cyclase [Bordetella sp. FB-8]|uniref:GGDEF domain-containing protein n=1 Tax=Bordetella sp. FB-8 TaxID=1159870 RepID=UPI000382D77F|nr:diguanylate cyclase [Bordetella sp. FB-8]
MPLPAYAGDTPAHPYASRDTALELGFQQCIEQFRTALLTAPLGWLFVAWLAWGRISQPLLLNWLIPFVLAWTVSLIILARLTHRHITVARDARLLYLAAVLDGLAWGSSLLLLSMDEHLYLELIVVLCAITALMGPTFISHIRAYRFHSVAIYAMVCISCAYHRDYAYVEALPLLTGMALFMLLIHAHTQRASARVLYGLQLQIENAQLTDQLRERLRAARHDATTDPLTGLANRRVLDSALATWQNRVVHSARQLSVLMVDIDHFKQVNDTYGHEVGDRVLRAFAEHVRSLLRSQDLFARHGGEEFVILLPDTPVEAATNAGDRIRASLENMPLINNPPVRITVSIGVAQHRDSESIDTTMARADAAAYSAKHLGRNKVHLAP